MGDGQRADFFISRAGESRAWGLWVARELQSARYSVIYQDRDFDNGRLLAPQIGDASSRSEKTLVLVSPAYFTSDWTQLEYSAALQRMLLFRVADVKLRPELQAFVFTDLFDADEEAARTILLNTVEQSYGPPKHLYDGEPPAPVPFPALRSSEDTASCIRLVSREGGPRLESQQRLTTIGRSPASMLRLTDPTVSWEHAQIILMRDGYHYRQVGLNPSTLSRKREQWQVGPGGREDVILHTGDRLTIGGTTFEVELDLAASDSGTGYISTENKS